MHEYEFYITGALMVATCMLMWFRTNLYVHILEILKKLNIIQMDEVWTRDDAATWVTFRKPLLGELLSCPGCLSFHLSWMTGLVWGLCCEVSWHWIIAGWWTWPFISNYLLK